MNRFLFVAVALLASLSIGSADPERSLTSWVNFDCDTSDCAKSQDQQSDWNFVYTRSEATSQASKADQSKDVHFFSSTKGGLPAFLVVEAPKPTTLKVNWSSLIDNDSDSINLVGDPSSTTDRNTIGLVLQEIFVWNDTNQDGIIDSNEPKTSIPLTQLYWSNVTDTEFNDQTASASYKLKSTQGEKMFSGDFEINVRSDSETRHFERLPRLYYSPKCMHIEILLNNVVFNLPWNSTRIGMHLNLVNFAASNPVDESFESINDEYSPGIFRENAFTFEDNQKARSFILFKPNAYNSNTRHIAQAVEIKQNGFKPVPNANILKSNNVLNGYFNNSTDNMKVWDMQITFGDSNDQLYSDTNYTVFSVVIGLDDIPKASLSLFIQIIIIIGSGLTLLVLLIFPVSICLMARNMRIRREMALLNQENVQY